MKKKIKRIILLVLLLGILAAILYVAPRAVAVKKMHDEAVSLVASSSDATFMETKTTIVYDTNGNELCEIKNSRDMYYVSIDQIPETLADAFIVMEDNDFYTHSGIDYKAIIRATLVNRQQGKIVQGASTITQQLARNIFLSQEVTWERKIEEMFIAEQLEKKYTKEKILEFYLNNIYFSNGYYGVEAAARGYFNKSVSELTVPEQAFIAAIPNGPTKYNPLTNYDNTAERKNVILRKLYEGDYISSMTYYTACNEEVQMSLSESTDASDSVVTYVRHCATESLMEAAGFTFRYNFDSQEEYEEYEEVYDKYYTMYLQMIVSGGYTIYTSINPDIQQKLQTVLDDELSDYQGLSDDGVYEMQGSATCIDNATGNVVAIVGSRSQDNGGLVLNRAYQSYRQSGSAIKPLSVYLPYFMLGHTPDETVVDEYIANGPVNADRTYAGEMTIRDAIKYSKNTTAWKVYQEITPRVGISYLMKMGFKKVWYDKDYNAAALGGFTYGVTSEEMAAAYATIANDGVYRRATCVISIYGSTGQLIRDESSRGTRIYSTNCARLMTQTLQAVMEPGGTGAAGAVDGWQIAGKTGSTNSNKDIWFCGYSPYYTTAVWMGYDYPKEIDGRNATPYIFKNFMTQIHENLVVKTFPEAKGETATNSATTEAATGETMSSAPEETSTGTVTEQATATTATEQATGAGTQSTTSAQRTTSAVNTQTSGDSGNNRATMAHPGSDSDVDISGSGDSDAATRGDADGAIRGDSDAW